MHFMNFICFQIQIKKPVRFSNPYFKVWWFVYNFRLPVVKRRFKRCLCFVGISSITVVNLYFIILLKCIFSLSKNMKNKLKRPLLIVLILMSIGITGYAFSYQTNATCTGSKNCSACKNCKYCKHCSQSGKTCGVCK